MKPSRLENLHRYTMNYNAIHSHAAKLNSPTILHCLFSLRNHSLYISVRFTNRDQKLYPISIYICPRNFAPSTVSIFILYIYFPYTIHSLLHKLNCTTKFNMWAIEEHNKNTLIRIWLYGIYYTALLLYPTNHLLNA